MSKVKLKILNMTEGNPLTTILIFAIPMILSNLFQQFYSLIDGIIVGKLLGTDAFVAVASAGSITASFACEYTGRITFYECNLFEVLYCWLYTAFCL